MDNLFSLKLGLQLVDIGILSLVTSFQSILFTNVKSKTTSCGTLDYESWQLIKSAWTNKIPLLAFLCILKLTSHVKAKTKAFALFRSWPPDSPSPGPGYVTYKISSFHHCTYNYLFTHSLPFSHMSSPCYFFCLSFSSCRTICHPFFAHP